MSILLDKIQSFKSNQFQEVASHYESLKDGQKPHTFLITCADSRLCPQEFSQTQAGELFVIRNAGNLVPVYDEENPTNEGLTLEYGITALGIGEIVVCGHASCGAMGGLADVDHLTSLPIVYKALKTYRESHESDIEGKDLNELINWNVNTQLHALFSYPFVRKGLEDGSLKVFGMVYDFVHGEVTFNSELKANGEVV